MRILKVSFRNLNSLTGSHEIDLSSGPLADAGIFAITGPTGSGKSTILDAITLALYGRAARYGSVANPADMMSRHTGDCSAEVVFEVPDGRFRAAWHLNRARKKFDGNVQQAKRYLYDANDQPLAQKITEVNQMITTLVGLDADRFLRSVLLAQNEFARFLRASADERATLLESLTGTEVYSRLGILTHQLYAKKENELKSQLQQIDTIELLEPDERKEIEERIDSTKTRVAGNTEKLERLRDEINRGVQLEKLILQQRALEANRSELEQEIASFAESAKRLDLYKEALHFRDDLNAIDRLIKSHESNQTHAKESDNELACTTTRLKCVYGSAQSLASCLETQLNDQVDELHKQRAENEIESKSLKGWLHENAVDAELISAMGEISVALEKLANSRTSLKGRVEQEKSLAEKVSETEREIARLTESLNAAKNYKAGQEKSVHEAKTLLERVSAGKTIVQLETEIERTREIQQGLRELLVMIQQYDELQEKQRSLQERIVALRETREKAERNSQEAKALVTKQLQLVDSLRESHERGVLIAKLQDHRHDLEDGRPCPLCGALEHPYAASSPITESRLKDDAKKLRDAGAEHKRLDMKRTDAEKDVIRSEHKLDSESRIYDAGQRQSDEQKTEILTKAESVGLVDPDRKQAAAEIDLQTARKASLEKQLATMRETIGQIAHLETHVVEAAGKLEVAKSDLAHEKSKVDALQKEIQAAKEKAVESESSIAADSKHVVRLLEDYLPENDRLPDPDQEDHLREMLAARCEAFRKATEKQQILIDSLRSFSDREKQLLSEKESISHSAKSFRDVSFNESDLLPEDSAEAETIQNEVVSICADWNTIEQAQHQIDSLRSVSHAAAATATERKSKLAESAEELRIAREAFAAKVGESQFENVDTLRTAMLSDEEFAELDSARSSMATRLSENRGELKSVVDTLAALHEQQTPAGEELAARREQLAQQEAELKQFQTLVTELEMQIRNDDKNRELHQDRSREVQEEMRRMESWRKLRGLIGSADGKKFRLFAQGLTLDVLVRLANRHLNKLSSRYQLRRVEGEQLDLEICDLLQAGTRRPMKSLSGGESFVASLALALGLSDLAGRNVRIDSLFIDEGFGSLDPDTLDVAVAALEGLQASNKTIGVISHVELLKERITTQIRVVPGGGGVSELQIVG